MKQKTIETIVNIYRFTVDETDVGLKVQINNSIYEYPNSAYR